MISIGKDDPKALKKVAETSRSRQRFEQQAKRNAEKKMNNDKVARLQKAGVMK